jgi:hypothetical protein
MQGWVQELLSLFRIESLDQLGRVLEVREEHGDLLALAFEGGAGGEDLLGETPRGMYEPGMFLARGWR